MLNTFCAGNRLYLLFDSFPNLGLAGRLHNDIKLGANDPHTSRWKPVERKKEEKIY